MCVILLYFYEIQFSCTSFSLISRQYRAVCFLHESRVNPLFVLDWQSGKVETHDSRIGGSSLVFKFVKVNSAALKIEIGKVSVFSLIGWHFV